MWELVAIVALLAAALAFCCMTMAFHIARVSRTNEALVDRIMATDWPSYAGYVKGKWETMTPWHLRQPETMSVRAKKDDFGLDLTDESQQIPRPEEAETVATFRA